MNDFIRADEYCKTVFDGTHDSPKPSKNGYKLITSKYLINNKIDFKSAYNISEEDFNFVNKRSAVKQWDVLFSMIGTVGTVYLEKNKNIDYAIKNVGVFSCEDEYKAKFLYYYLQSPYASILIQNYLNGAIQKFLPLGFLREFPIPKYEKKYEKIVKLLDSLDRKIDLNNELISNIDDSLNEIYNYWFLDFNFPDKNNLPYKHNGGKMKHCEELQIDIPECWNINNLENKILLTKGISYTSKDIEKKAGVPMLNLANIDTTRNLRIDELKFYNGNVSEDKKVYPDDLLIACTDLTRNADIVGSPILVPNYYTEYAYTMDLCKLQILSDDIDKYYLYMNLRTEFYHNYIKYFASGTNVLHLDIDGLYWYNMIIPSIDIQRKFSKVADNMLHQRNELILESLKTNSLKNKLLPLLMNEIIKM